MNTRKLIPLVVIALGLLLALTGCGPKRVLPQGASIEVIVRTDHECAIIMPMAPHVPGKAAI